MSKRRITVTLDESVLATAREAVSEGRSESVSAFVNDCLIERQEAERRFAALDELIADYESEHGVITEREMVEQERLDREAAAAWRPDARRTG